MQPNCLFGFKDPRTARLLPLWMKIFKQLDLAPKFILCLRAPSQIARSLQRRDGLDLAAGEYRTLIYLTDCFRYIARRNICIVDYEEWFGDYSKNLEGLMSFLDIEWVQSDVDLAAGVAEIVDRDLRHSETELGIARQPLVRSFHNLLADLPNDPMRRSKIGRFVNQFAAFQQLLQPFERTQRRLSVLAAHVPGLQAKVAELEAALQANKADIQKRENSLCYELATQQREVEIIRAALSELGRKEQALRISDAATRNEFTIAREELSAIKQREQQTGENNVSLRNKLAVMQATLSTEQMRLAEGQAHFADREAILQGNIAAAQRREQELRASHETEKNSLETQVRALRDRLVDAAIAKPTMQDSRGKWRTFLSLPGRSRRMERKLICSGLIDEEWYRATYKDVAQSGFSPVKHYLNEGFMRGYRPNPFFDTRWYLDRYEDVRRAGINPLLHYLLHGSREGRDPGPGFQTEYYLEANSDVRDNRMNPLGHYLLHGRYEGRLPTRPV